MTFEALEAVEMKMMETMDAIENWMSGYTRGTGPRRVIDIAD